MSSSRENILITGNSLQEIKNSLNFALQRISDRLDKIEGIRGSSEIRSSLNLHDNLLINVSNFDQNLGSTDRPTFAGLILSGNMTITGATDSDSFTVTDSNSTVIHEFS